MTPPPTAKVVSKVAAFATSSAALRGDAAERANSRMTAGVMATAMITEMGYMIFMAAQQQASHRDRPRELDGDGRAHDRLFALEPAGSNGPCIA